LAPHLEQAAPRGDGRRRFDPSVLHKHAAMEPIGTIRTTSQAVIDAMLSKARIAASHRVLEPSAGIGVLADGIRRVEPEAALVCVELNQKCVDVLRSKGYDTVHSNFFHYKPGAIFDYIIASPTFKDNVDCDHVRHMYELLAQHGEIVSLMSPAWMTGYT